MKKRTKMFCGGSRKTTGAPAASVSPENAITSATRPASGETTERWSSRHCACLSAASSESTSDFCASISRPAHGRLTGRERGGDRCDLRFRRTQGGVLLIDDLLGRRARLQQR